MPRPWFRRLTPTVLAATVVAAATAVSLPLTAAAAPAPAGAAANAAKAPAADPAITPASARPRTAPAAAGALSGAPDEQEVVRLRTESSRTVVVPGGGYRTQVFAGPVNYRDAAGAWQPIDTTLVKDDDGWHPKAAGYTAQLPGRLGAGPVTVSAGSRWVSLRLTGAADVAGTVTGSRVTYAEVFPGVSLVYDALPTGLKESVVLAGPSARSDFAFAVRASAGLTASVSAAGAVRVADAAGGTVFTLPAGFVTDRDDQASGRAAVTTRLASAAALASATGAGLQVSVAKSWLARAGRSWPVVLDPNVTIGPDKITDCTIGSGPQAAVNTCAADNVEVGYGNSSVGYYVRRQLMKFDLSAIPQSAVVKDADLKLVRVSAGQVAATFPVQLLRLAKDWTTAATWNNSGTAAWTGGLWGPTQIDKRTVDNTAAEVHFYPGYLVQLWVQKAQANQGLILKSENEATIGHARFGSSTNPDASLRPSLTVAWMVQHGQRETNTFVTKPLTDRCEAGANVANGNLLVRCAELTVGGVGQPVSVSRYYNSGNGPEFLNRADGPLGINRWRLSTGVYLLVRANSVEFQDGSGALYPFQQLGGTGYRQAPGLGATLEKDQPAAGQYRLKFHQSGAQYVFAKANSDFFNVTWQLSKIIDRNGNTTTFTYAAKAGYAEGALSTIKDTRGRVVTFGYTADAGSGKDFLTSITDSSGRHADFSYTGWNLTTATDTNGKTTTYGYGDFGTSTAQLSSFTDPRGNATQFGYDTDGRVLDINQHPDGTQTANTHVTYNDSVNTTSVRDARNNTTTYTVQHKDYASRVTKALDAKGKERSRTFTSNAKVGTVTNEFGTTTNTWGGNLTDTNDTGSGESLTKSVGPAGAGSLTEYKSAAASACPAGATSSGSGYDAICSQDDAGNKSTYSYDGAGNRSQSKNATAAVAKVDRAVNGSGSTPTDGRVLKSTDPLNRVTTYNYADVTFNAVTTKRLSSITPPSGSGLGTRTLTYDGVDRLKTYTTGRTTTATLAYDGDDRVTDITYSDSTPAVHNTYDGNGNLTQRVDGTGTTVYGYDRMNRATSKTLPGGRVLGYGYDLVGNLTSASQDGVTTSYGYDTVNQVTSMTERSGRTTRFAYRSDGKRTDTWYGANATTPPSTFAAHIHTDFDPSGRVSRIKTTRASSEADANRVEDYTYCHRPKVAGSTTCSTASDTVNDRDKIQWGLNNLNGVVTSFTYDGAGRLTSKTSGTTTTSTYDAAGNRTAEKEPGKTDRNYGYNPANQICWSGATAGSGCTAPTGSNTNYAHDAAGNQTKNPDLSTLAYNGTEQATSITPNSAAATSFGYAGDSQSERVSKGGTTYVNGLLGLQSETTGGQTTYYERDPSGQLVSERTPVGDFYYVFSNVGTVVALIDSNGLQRASYAYTVWGEDRGTAAQNGALPPNPYRFAGEYLDSETGLYKIGLRYYSPSQARWTQQDSIETIGDPANGNRYAYAGDDPLNNTDPTGAFWGEAATALGIASTVFDAAAVVTAFTPLAEFSPALGAIGTGLDVASTGATCIDQGFTSGACAGSALSSAAGGVYGKAASWAASDGYKAASYGFQAAGLANDGFGIAGWTTP